jgi:hypothetical protein
MLFFQRSCEKINYIPSKLIHSPTSKKVSKNYNEN